MGTRFTLQLGDLTAAKVDAIVNSTRENLVEGGPLHLAVHAAAGAGLLAECQSLGECPAGEVRVTAAFDLPFQFIIHAVPPTWMGGGHGEAEELAACYRKSLELAKARGASSLAFPSLGSGLQPQIPLEIAAPIAVRTVLDFLDLNELPERVVLVCFDVASYQAHQKILREALP
jgi:O-acetyl-ADP-ribose deacetylase (regulator of RNase III)